MTKKCYVRKHDINYWINSFYVKKIDSTYNTTRTNNLVNIYIIETTSKFRAYL